MLREFLKVDKNRVGVIRLLTLARMSSLSLKRQNKVGAVIVDLDTKELGIGWNYAIDSTLETYKNGREVTLKTSSLYDTDDDLRTNHGHIIHAEQAALEHFFENRENKDRLLACFVSRKPCKICQELLAKHKVTYIVYPDDALQTMVTDSLWYGMYLYNNYSTPSILFNFQEVLC